MPRIWQCGGMNVRTMAVHEEIIIIIIIITITIMIIIIIIVNIVMTAVGDNEDGDT